MARYHQVYNIFRTMSASSQVLTAICTDSQATWLVSKFFLNHYNWHNAWLFVRLCRLENSMWQGFPGGKHRRFSWSLLAENAKVFSAQDTNPDIFGGKGLDQETSDSSQSSREMPPSKVQIHPNISRPTPTYSIPPQKPVGLLPTSPSCTRC